MPPLMRWGRPAMRWRLASLGTELTAVLRVMCAVLAGLNYRSRSIRAWVSRKSRPAKSTWGSVAEWAEFRTEPVRQWLRGARIRWTGEHGLFPGGEACLGGFSAFPKNARPEISIRTDEMACHCSFPYSS